MITTRRYTTLLKLLLIFFSLTLVVFLGGCGDDDDDVTVILDDEETGFVKSGSNQTWYRGDGYKGDSYWTATSIDIARNSVRWTPDLPKSGNYSVQAYIPSEHSTTTNAKYTIVAGGEQSTIAVNQSIFTDEWVELGVFSFNADGTEYVELTDFTGENGLEISFDAMMWDRQ